MPRPKGSANRAPAIVHAAQLTLMAAQIDLDEIRRDISVAYGRNPAPPHVVTAFRHIGVCKKKLAGHNAHLARMFAGAA